MQNNPSMNAPPSPHYSFFFICVHSLYDTATYFFLWFHYYEKFDLEYLLNWRKLAKKTTLYLSIIKIENFWVAYSSFVATKKQVLKECIKFDFYPNQIQMTIRRTFNFVHIF